MAVNPYEARSWIRSHTPRRGNDRGQSPLAWNMRFMAASDALSFVDSLYSAGAVEVVVDPDSRNKAWNPRTQNYHTPADAKAYALLIRLPAGPKKADRVTGVLDEEQARYPEPRGPFDVAGMVAAVNPHGNERHLTPAQGGPVVRLAWQSTGHSPV